MQYVAISVAAALPYAAGLFDSRHFLVADLCRHSILDAGVFRIYLAQELTARCQKVFQFLRCFAAETGNFGELFECGHFQPLHRTEFFQQC